MSVETESNLEASIEADLFWERQRPKLIAGGVAFVVALVAWGGWASFQHSRAEGARAALAAAKDEPGFRTVIDGFSGTPAAGDALILLAKLQREAGRMGDAVATLDRFLADYTEHPFAGGARLSRALTLDAMGKNEEAAAAYSEVEARDASTYAAPIAALMAALRLEREGKREEAVTALENLIAQYPDSVILEEAKQRLAMLRR